MHAGTDPEEFSFSRLFTTTTGHLALALLAVELIAGMQQFLLGTVTPLIAADLDGHQLYGVTMAASQVAVFLTMPLGAGLMQRFSPSQLLMWFTPITVLAGILGALAPTMWIFIATRVLAGLAGGVLATVGMGAIVTGLPTRWRQLVLAANNLMWLISAVVGPAYAAWISHALSWRWAMVLYLPFLLLARWVIAKRLPHTPRTEERSKLPLVPAALLALGIAGILVTAVNEWWGWALGGLGLLLVAGGLPVVLPRGILTLRPGSRAAIGLLALLAVLVFCTDSIVAILAHDVLGFDPFRLGILLTSMSFCWSLVGLFCGRWPVSGHRFRVRGGIGLAILAVGIVAMGLAFEARHGTGYIAGFAVVGTGMGLVFLDAMNVAFTPDVTDPLAPTDAASASVLAQQVVAASLMTVCTSLVAIDPTWGGAILFAIALATPLAFFALWRASAEPR